MGAALRVTLEFLGEEPHGLRFRVSFDSSQSRWLLFYPDVTGLRFAPRDGGQAPAWTTRYLVTEPRDEFVLNPRDRIGFDLVARVNTSSDENGRWTLSLPPGEYDARYAYTVDPGQARYDYLGKGSLFADRTPPWVGTAESDPVRVTVRI